MDTERIDGKQFIFMVAMFLLGTSTIISTGTEAGNNFWLVSILASLYSILLIYIYAAIVKDYPGKSLIEILPDIVGNFFGKIIGLIYILFFLHLLSLVLRNLSDFMTLILPRTPISVFPITFMLLATYAIKKGLEVIGRVSTWFFVVTMIIIGINVILLIPEMNLSAMLPAFEEGLKPIAKGFISASGFPFSEIVTFLMIMPYLNSNEFPKRKISFITGVIIFLFINILLGIRNHAVLGSLIKFTLYPSFITVEYASVANVLENLAPFFMLAFIVSIFSKTIILFYAGVVGIAQWANLKEYKFLSLPLILIITTLSISQFESVGENVQFARRIYPLYIFPLSFIIPLLLLVIMKLKGKSSSNKDYQSDNS